MIKEDLFKFEDEDEVKSVFHNFEEEPILEGILINIEQGPYGNQYLIEKRDNNKLVIVGKKTALEHKINNKNIGSLIRIEYLGVKPSNKVKGREYEDFKVFIKKIT
jgi:hypothetical protein